MMGINIQVKDLHTFKALKKAIVITFLYHAKVNSSSLIDNNSYHSVKVYKILIHTYVNYSACKVL